MTETIRISPQYTLGGGNHFIEVCLDGENPVWVMLHSGSRGGGGNAIADDFIQSVCKDMERWMIQLPDRDLAYLAEGSEHFAITSRRCIGHRNKRWPTGKRCSI